MSDLPAKLRQRLARLNDENLGDIEEVVREAADEIERLREALAEAKTGLLVLGPMLRAANLCVGSRRCMELLITVDAALGGEA